MSISQNFPEEGPTLNLNFASSKTLDPRITFTRTSSATYTDDNGLIRVAPTNSPRFDHRYNPTTGEIESLGLLVEEARTNLLLRSEEFDNASWGKLNVGIITNTSASTAPDGTNNAEKLTENSINNAHYISVGISVISGTTYTLSIFAKPAERNVITLSFANQFPINSFADFNLSNGTIISSGPGVITSFIQSYPNGWYRCSIVGTSTNTSTSSLVYYLNNGSNVSYQGDGSSGVYIWGAQLEAGDFPTSYIPTTNATATRTADNASMTGTNFSSWYNPSEGTVLFSGRAGGSSEAGMLNFSNSSVKSPTELIRYTYIFNTSRFLGLVSSNNVFDLFTSSQYSRTSLSKSAGCYKLNDFANVVNGGTVGVDTSGNVPAVNSLYLGDNSGYANHLNGTIAQLTYYPVRLTNAQLQTLTR